ncbi:MAG: MATE family efflux transporter [Myxococcales bacterium]|nr:MAG: MATE family efflux transporter [Myxococcales bacterium]
MTKISHNQVWRLATPIIIGHISVPLLGMMDTAVVGRLPGPEPLGALALGNLVFNYLYWGFGFLRMGTTGPTAQAWGSGNHEEVSKLAKRAFVLSFCISIVIVLLQVPIIYFALRLISADEQLKTLASSYFYARVWGAPAALGNFVIIGWLLGIQQARSVLWIQLWMNGLNIVLDLLMVFVFHQGVAGVGYATAVSEYAAFAAGIVSMQHFAPQLFELKEWKEAFHLRALAPMLSINGDLFVRTLCLISSFALLTFMGARMGRLVLASNALLMNFQLFASYSLDGFAHAAEALVGQSLGAKDRKAYWSAVKISTVWAAGMAIIYVLVYGAFGGALIDTLSIDPAVQSEARRFLPWLIITPVVSVWSYQLDGIFAGSTRSKEMRNSMMLSFALYVALVFVLVPRFDNHGLWAAFMLFMVFRAITLGLRLFQKRDEDSQDDESRPLCNGS